MWRKTRGSRSAAPAGAVATASTQSGGIVGRILGQARHGDPPADIARTVGMPVSFVRQVIESAAADGRIDIADWHGTCASGSCSPQPGSLLCAGCPFRPR